MKNIAIVNQRYGLTVNGGSEYFTRQLAEHLACDCNITILTTCAEKYDTWENTFAPGREQIHQIEVLRFSTAKQRNPKWFRILSKLVRSLPLTPEWLEQWWAKEQGPYAPALLQYIEEKQQDYDKFVFVTYLYYLTLKGLPKVAEKSILIPTAHNEPYIYFKIYQEIFQQAKGIAYLTEEEKYFVNQLFHNEAIPDIVAGIGIEVPDITNPSEFQRNYQLNEGYLIYVGRIDEGKNCSEMFEFFLHYKKRYPSGKKLVLLGKTVMEIPEEEDILYLGYLEEKEKYDAISGSCALWMPSKYESLSISVLEAMALGKPVLVNGNCEVLKGHCEKSGAGLYYQNRLEFEQCLQRLWKETPEYRKMCRKGKKYIDRYYTWDKVMERYRGLILE